MLCLQHKYELKQVTWQAKGDYFTTLNPQSNKTAILVHQSSKFTTQVHALVRACACVSCVRESNCVPETFSAERIFKKTKAMRRACASFPHRCICPQIPCKHLWRLTFCPVQPILFVALHRREQVHNLVKQSMVSRAFLALRLHA